MGQESRTAKETKQDTEQPEKNFAEAAGKTLTRNSAHRWSRETQTTPQTDKSALSERKKGKGKTPAKLRRPERSPTARKPAARHSRATETSGETNPPDTTNQNPQTKRRSEKDKARRRRALPGKKQELGTAHRRLPETQDSGSLKRTSDDHEVTPGLTSRTEEGRRRRRGPGG